MASKICAVIDYGMGNLHSAHGALQTVSPDTQVIVTGDPEVIMKADHVVLPGVGAIRDCMAEIRAQGIDQVVAEVRKTKPLLGICVGLQAMMDRSEENGGVDCMGLFPGQVRYFGDNLVENGERLKVPHMGWNQVQQVVHPLWTGIADNSRFYFVHSYYVDAVNAGQVKGHGQYGVDFAAAMGEDNVFAVQFHPEKSHNAGLALLKNFLSWDGQA
ncbi:MAG: imidazole glycerol phosphate synthase subunit HisH [Thalassolituus sp.]|jgi:glutamine amidotransferase|uniref:Imidazole glycerol phosphate synthase subunit HisH n=2 Tax=root TaxID=1 RepID=M5DMZ2_9GAMM|nr:imidazole glycerol phosphate synthase subunit HisH [Thalassolituus oleivorans]PCI47428.1 MAG: imidazole glycerol phosphate synthase subunit HisH [Oceanospirillales bacterium]AHK14827.1 imidazole glycerol phosphate synthase [Thalassolituus oleivorans R6-15]APR65851.1 imidazole glycerol phosphate synthase subunit HisH [Thalassolituus oleivorans]MCA6129272.1 imidazole glycerol phosphate synthase [Thalassolituus oleivorans 4BN06-13]CCU70798.1 imidazole glycerol phosphate synthase subunit HisH [